MEKFRISVEITEYENGEIVVRQLNPGGPINQFYGPWLGWGQVAKLGALFLCHLGMFMESAEISMEEEEISFGPSPEQLEFKRHYLMRKRWDKMKAKMTPLIYARYSELCAACGRSDDMTIDHIIPISKGGTNDLENLQPLCKSCNSSKGAK